MTGLRGHADRLRLPRRKPRRLPRGGCHIHNNQYTIQWGKRSHLEIPVGQELKDEYGLGYHERLRLEVRGNPKWDGKQGRLELEYDEVSDTFRAFQPVTR